MSKIQEVLDQLQADETAKPVIEKLKPAIDEELTFWKGEAQSAFSKRDEAKKEREDLNKKLDETQTSLSKAIEEANNKHSQELKNLSDERDRFKSAADTYREHLLSQLPDGKLKELGAKLTDLKDLRDMVESMPQGATVSKQPPATKGEHKFNSLADWKKAAEA